MDFHAFNFHPHVAAGITAAGFVTPTPIQAKAIPPVMQGRAPARPPRLPCRYSTVSSGVPVDGSAP